MLARVTGMRGVDLDLFDFDFDLTWAAFFLSPEGKVLGRFGGRDPDDPGRYLTTAGLKHAMTEALAAHRRGPRGRDEPGPRQPRTADQFPAAARLPARACIHCHHVYEFRREALQQAGTWRPEGVWVYPLPENVGLSLDPDRGNRVLRVAAGSAAARAGLRPGDDLKRVGGERVASFADVQYALHRAPAPGELALSWERGGKALEGTVALADGWRKTDVSWRWSLKALRPDPCLHGEDLTAAEKQELGLPETRLAFRQGNFVTKTARQAGVEQNDIVLGFDGKTLEMTARQFDAHVRLTYRPGDRVTVNVLRAGRRLDLVMRLPG